MTDLNIDNYSVEDMHKILKLDNPTNQEVNAKVDSLVLKMIKHKKYDMANFLEKIRTKLIKEDEDS